MSPKTDTLPALVPGSVAIRFRTVWRGHPARPVVAGLQAVWIVEASGDRVTWTNFAPGRGRLEFRRTCDRRELFTVNALENLSTDATHGSPEPEPLQIAVAGVVASV